MNPYRRTAGQKAHDFQNAKVWEAEVREVLGPYVWDKTSSNNEMDFMVPGFALETKEKNQPLTPRWQLLPGVPEVDLFIMDELTVRRALSKDSTGAYFLIRDNPGGGRLFIASAIELACIERVRRQRDGKGKWIINMTDLHPLGVEAEAVPYIMADLVRIPWKLSQCLGAKTPPQV